MEKRKVEINLLWKINYEFGPARIDAPSVMEKTAMVQQGALEKALRRWLELRMELRKWCSSLRTTRKYMDSRVVPGPGADGIKANIHTKDGKSFDIPQVPCPRPRPPLKYWSGASFPPGGRIPRCTPQPPLLQVKRAGREEEEEKGNGCRLHLRSQQSQL